MNYKYLYMPQDIAVFLLKADFVQSDERTTVRAIWENESHNIPMKYQDDYTIFWRHIQLALSKLDGSLEDLDELNILLRDTEHALYIDGSLDEQGVIESYFKIIKLELTYIEGKDYRKIKLRSLLKQFGYKRRSFLLVKHIQRTLAVLGLKAYLKGYVPCNIAKTGIDDIVILRLEKRMEPKDYKNL